MQFAGSLGRLAHLRGAGASAGNLVRVVATEQATIGTLDYRRFAGGGYAKRPQRLLIGAAAADHWLAFRRVIGGQRLQLLRRPTQPLAPLIDQVALGLICP